MATSPSQIGPEIHPASHFHSVKQEAQQVLQPQPPSVCIPQEFSQRKRKAQQIADSSSSDHLEHPSPDCDKNKIKNKTLVMESSRSVESRDRDGGNNHNNSNSNNDNNNDNNHDNSNRNNDSSLSWTTHHLQPQRHSPDPQGNMPDQGGNPSISTPPINLAGTTALDARFMTPLERQMVLLKRKLRNRESARRSRIKKQRNLIQLNDEYKELVQRTSGLCSFVGQLGRENGEMMEMNRRLRRAVEELERKSKDGKKEAL